ncbi:Bcyvc1 [Botrytis cinerea B05.10]|uniref:Bcyvc1 n=3 Tax=Botryotinia fuckeliana TaxID=40559 RepID=A0A384JY67_BOTFB|nr:Bcyvc1 [Botrytis cinerea B05.10]ATZ55478.1 Bcyvc1 [Botrytis cinerea B05.10]EMR87932.1 putative potassium ion channel yvc1 protein [Botrytis cinerea BcDW1]
MVQWRKLFGLDGSADQHLWRDEARRLLPSYREDEFQSAIPPLEVTKTALRLRYLIEESVPCELEEANIVCAHSKIITRKVIAAAREAGGKDYGACVVYALLVCKRWFKKQAMLELWDADLHNVRAVACEVIAKQLIETEEDQEYLLQKVLLKRYSVLVDGEQTTPANVIERAVDLHALRVTGSSGYQKCVNYLWRGWLVQDENDPSQFVDYKKKDNTNYWTHVDPDRMRAPIYQNATQIIFSLIYLALYTGAINTVNPSGDLDIVEIILYIFTAGFICDEASKFWKVGRYYIGFWNVFNVILYALLTTSLITRIIALGHPLQDDDGKRGKFNELSYNFLAFSAPMFWMRLLLYLDSIRFFGAMLVVIKVMMKESLIFFALLFVIIIGFLQAFIGMDMADSNVDSATFILQAMANAVMQSPDFSGFDNFAPPFGIILYYIFTFLIMVVLLNILIALYNSAYEDITDNAIDEYLALFSQKTMQFVRAPDENVFIAPTNLIEIFFLILPCEWWMPRKQYAKLNDYVMAVVYSPLLLIAAWFEQRSAIKVKGNRQRGDDDDGTVEEWEQLDGEVDFAGEGWEKRVKSVVPDVESDEATCEVRELRKEVGELKELLLKLVKEKDGGSDKGKGKKK